MDPSVQRAVAAETDEELAALLTTSDQQKSEGVVPRYMEIKGFVHDFQSKQGTLEDFEVTEYLGVVLPQIKQECKIFTDE